MRPIAAGMDVDLADWEDGKTGAFGVFDGAFASGIEHGDAIDDDQVTVVPVRELKAQAPAVAILGIGSVSHLPAVDVADPVNLAGACV